MFNNKKTLQLLRSFFISSWYQQENAGFECVRHTVVLFYVVTHNDIFESPLKRSNI
ncbi:MAG: hypothetical protein UR53_C0004G0008 [Candidatus Magasanikbacteria bacterium GW2011_GWC2_34_16]|uniref:Uncharacterized protein n=2 Tax=Candidatus Magasanikiibacteriota TaxID=1752731 RepID=A0A0G0H7H7_9BACT|nr:MAG: hypothetical protein UR53_C0004G0008 [Candidatus Magasanikbacteria bacterium GW2011_GWC2_34_16]KKQ39188.1 MAG: hypothetical protein US58_C0039G0007 [Candidatus Magasanikbacteria bacterium GW2011_GWA2_37_8]